MELGAPKVLVAVCLMVMWSTNVPPIRPRFQFLDLFAGVANATKIWSGAGYCTATVDESHHPGERVMNFLTPPGFLLVIYIVLNEVEEAVNLLGPECGSWGLPARGTSLRTYVNIFGAMAVPFVAEANECIGKIVMALYLIVAKHAFYVLEQPAQSLMERSPRFETFMNHTSYAYRVRFWMQLLGHGSPKPTVGYSNASWVSWLDMGTLTKEYRLANTVLKTTRRYVNKEGKQKFCGSAQLKQSACYPEGFARRLKEAFENRTGFPRHMRFKMKIDRKLTDRELFEKMPLGDVWVDAKMHLVWKYIYSSKYVTIPSSWESAMRQFDSELTAAVTIPEDVREAYNIDVAASSRTKDTK